MSVKSRELEAVTAIFGKELVELDCLNPFAYTPSSGFYDTPKKFNFNIGFVFNTPSGRESKVYPYLNIRDSINDTESFEHGQGTPKRVLEKIQGATTSTALNFYFKGDRLKPKYNLGIKYFVVSCGSGGLDCFKVELEDI